MQESRQKNCICVRQWYDKEVNGFPQTDPPPNLWNPQRLCCTEGGIKVAHQLTLERLCWIPTGGPNIITLILKQGRETQKDENQRNGTERKTDWSLSALSDDEKGASSLGSSCGCGLVCPTLATPWTVAWQAPLSMGFSRQEYWSGFANWAIRAAPRCWEELFPEPSERNEALLTPGFYPEETHFGLFTSRTVK